MAREATAIVDAIAARPRRRDAEERAIFIWRLLPVGAHDNPRWLPAQGWRRIIGCIRMSPDVTGWMLAIVLAGAVADARRSAARRRPAPLLDHGRRRGRRAATTRRPLARVRAADDAPAPARRCAWRPGPARAGSPPLAAADRGGTPEALAPVAEAVEVADRARARRARWPPMPRRCCGRPSAAAQDERDEMLVWIDEARALSTRLALVGPAPAVAAAGRSRRRRALARRRRLRTRGSRLHARARHARQPRWRGAAWPGPAIAVAIAPAPARPTAASQQRSGAASPRRGPLAVEARGYLLLCTP